MVQQLRVLLAFAEDLGWFPPHTYGTITVIPVAGAEGAGVWFGLVWFGLASLDIRHTYSTHTYTPASKHPYK